jgi:hypothetical protein
VLDIEDSTGGASDNRQPARLDLPGFVERSHRQAAPPSGLPSGLIQPGHGEPAHHPHRRDGVPHRKAEQPLGLSGARSPACAAIVHPFRLGIWLITAAAYLLACSHASVRAKHGRSNSSSSTRFRRASAAPILAAAAAFGFAVLTNA